ncbi:hypothetical protein [Pseudoalteromonas piscicida]|uniref:hypothetical protein n=1 Tax=Pseudoalteromonas piscicida TaxID=43662 RepID=UPI0030AD9DD6
MLTINKKDSLVDLVAQELTDEQASNIGGAGVPTCTITDSKGNEQTFQDPVGD